MTSRKRTVKDLTIDTDTRVDFDGRMHGARKLFKKGVGTLVLNHAGEMGHGVYLKQGRIELGHAQGLGTGTLFMDDGSAIDLMVDGMRIANNLHMTGSDDPIIDTGANHSNWTGDITGAGFLSKQGTGSLTLTSTANSYTGATEVAEGTLKAGAVNTFAAASIHSVAMGATMDLAGLDQTIASLNNGGTVQLSGTSGASGAVLKVTGPYVGKRGNLIMSAGHDRLLLSGATAVASGSTTVQLTNVDSLGAPITGHGMEIIGTENGASLQPGAFALAGGHVDAGAYAYRLSQTAQAASLQSSFRAEVPLVSALPAQLRQADMAMLGDMRKRLGDDAGSVDANAGQGRGAWGRILHTEPRIRQHGTVRPESSGHLSGFQAGLDLYAGPRIKAGLYVGQLLGNMAVNGVVSGAERQSAGHNRLQSRYLGLYGTWQGDAGFYADTVVQWADYRSHLHTQDSGAMTKGRGRLASLEVGKPVALNSHWQVEPQAQLIYRQLRLGDTALGRATVQHQAPSDWTLRLGMRIKASLTTRAGQLLPYGSVNVYKATHTSDVASFVAPAATTDILAKGGYTSTALAAGATLQVNQRTRFYGELSQHWANAGETRVKSGVQAAMGVKLRW